MIKNYTAARKTVEWYKKLSIHLLQVAMHNAYVIFRKDHPKIKFPFIKFIAEVNLYSIDPLTAS